MSGKVYELEARPSLMQLYATHTGKQSDKWGSYIKRYDELFAPYRDMPIRLLEIGVQNGGSLDIWAKYFTNAAIVGCDIDERCRSLKYDDSRIFVRIGDSKHSDLLSVGFDIVIDDGSHTSNDIVETFKAFFPSLINGGIYIIEDLHCSYWRGYQDAPVTSVEYLKTLIDPITTDSQEIHSIEFSNSLCIIRKEAWEKNGLGERLIVGSEKII